MSGVVYLLKMTLSPMAFAGVQMLVGAHQFILPGDGEFLLWLKDLLSNVQGKLSIPAFDNNALLVKGVTLDRQIGRIFPNFLFFHTLGTLKVLAIVTIWLPHHIRSPLPRWFAYTGLMTSCAVAAHGHQQIGQSAVVPLVMGTLTGLTWMFDRPGEKKLKSR